MIAEEAVEGETRVEAAQRRVRNIKEACREIAQMGQEPAKRTPSLYTYFIWATVPNQRVGPIKIGCASDPLARVYQLQTASPFDLTLIGYVPGGEKLERELHQKYDHLRLRGEWFQPTEEMERDIFDLILDDGIAIMEGLR